MQRKRVVAAPLMTTQPGSTGRISIRPAVQCWGDNQIISHLDLLTVFDLLYKVGSAEPWIEPSSVISRCSPALAAYRCLKRTTCSQPWGKWDPWSNKGKERTPAQRKRFATVMGSMRRTMFPLIPRWSLVVAPVCCVQWFRRYCAF